MQVPVLIDGDKNLKESFDIALYLERTYPNEPTLFGGKEGEASARFADNYANTAIGGDPMTKIFPPFMIESSQSFINEDFIILNSFWSRFRVQEK